MSVQVRYRREAASFLATFVGAQGEIIIDTTNNRVQVHDGTTPGGFPTARLADIGTLGLQNANAAAITGGSIDGTTLGQTTPAAAKVTSFQTTGTASFGGAVTISSGTIDGATIGVTSPAAVTGTLLTASGAASGTGGTINKLSCGFANFGIGVSTGSLDVCSNSNISFYRAGTLNGQITSTGLNALAIGATTPATVAATTLSTTGLATLSSMTTASATVTGGTINGASVGATTASTVRATVLSATTSLNLPSYTVATLPAAGTAGRNVHCSNARMVIAGGTGVTIQSASAGTGGLVTDDGTAWRVAGTNITAQA